MDVINTCANTTLRSEYAIVQDNQKCREQIAEKTLLKQRLQFYANESLKMENTLDLLYMIEDNKEMCTSRTKELVEKMAGLQERFGSRHFDIVSMRLTYANDLHRHEDCSNKLQMYLKLHSELSDKLNNHSKTAQNVLMESKVRMSNYTIATGELKTLRTKLNKYEADVLRLEKRYPWLKDPALNLLVISEEIESLKKTKEKENKLSTELASYKGLEPNIGEARSQLSQIRSDYENLTKNVLQLFCSK